MDTLIIFAVVIIFFLISGSNKKTRRSSPKKPLPPIRRPESDAKKRTLDYMMKKPETARTTPSALPDQGRQPEAKPQPRTFPEPQQETVLYPDTVHPQATVCPPGIQSALLQELPSQSSLGDMPHRGGQYISTDSQVILRAVAYAEVLNAPKSLKYLERYGIRRFPLK